MKIIIAPSKTMIETGSPGTTSPLFPDKSQALLDHLKQFDKNDLAAFFSVNETIASENYSRFQNFDARHKAMDAYTGFQFKHLDAPSLDAASRNYLEKHLYIMSGLYGIVRPTDTIGLYRLPMGLKLDGMFLKDHWKPLLTPYLKGETIINLASKEYSDAIDSDLVQIITVVFKLDDQGKLKSPAMENKKMRGKMVRFMAKNKIEKPENLTSFTVDNYRFDPHLSTDDTYVYIKKV